MPAGIPGRRAARRKPPAGEFRKDLVQAQGEENMKIVGAVRAGLYAVLTLAFLPGGRAVAQTALLPQAGIPGVIAPGAVVELVGKGYSFTEGPLDTPDGGLFFVDLRGANRIHRLDAKGNISLFRENSGGANGMAYTREGDLVAVEAVNLRLTRTNLATGRVDELTRGDGKIPLSQPNDLIVDSKGGVYFTDPGNLQAKPPVTPLVYYLPPGTDRPVAVNDTIRRPNGLTLTADEKTLIVADTIGTTIWQFDVNPDGSLRNQRPFGTIVATRPGDSGGDGLAIDREGRIFMTSRAGVQVFDRSGTLLGIILVPETPSNVAFSGPGKRILYITAVDRVYRIPTLTQGPARLGK
jgi:gluconolactonase